MNKQKSTNKEKELEMFETCLFDFLGEEPTKRKIVEAWKDYVSSLEENYEVPKAWYKLTMEEKRKLYKVAGL